MLADPIKAKLRDALLWAGPMRGSQLARTVPQASKNLTYHLGELERVGFIEEMQGSDGKRAQTKTWSAVEAAFSWDSTADDPTAALIGQAVDRTLEDLKYDLVKDWGTQKRNGEWSPEWVEAASEMTFKLCLTPAELDACVDEVSKVLQGWKERSAGRTPDGKTENVAFGITAYPRKVSD